MLWHPKEELDSLGPPRRKDLIWASIAFAILPFGILYQVSLLIRAVRDGTGADIAVRVAVLGFLLLMLWAAALWIQHWLHYRKK
jgi:hypothetical protein